MPQVGDSEAGREVTAPPSTSVFPPVDYAGAPGGKFSKAAVEEIQRELREAGEGDETLTVAEKTVTVAAAAMVDQLMMLPMLLDYIGKASARMFQADDRVIDSLPLDVLAGQRAMALGHVKYILGYISKFVSMSEGLLAEGADDENVRRFRKLLRSMDADTLKQAITMLEHLVDK